MKRASLIAVASLAMAAALGWSATEAQAEYRYRGGCEAWARAYDSARHRGDGNQAHIAAAHYAECTRTVRYDRNPFGGPGRYVTGRQMRQRSMSLSPEERYSEVARTRRGDIRRTVQRLRDEQDAAAAEAIGGMVIQGLGAAAAAGAFGGGSGGGHGYGH